MPYQIDWLLPHQVLYCQVVGDVGIETVAAINNELLAHLDQAALPLHLLINLHRIGHTPTNIQEIRHNQTYLKHPQLGWVILSSQHPFLNFASLIITQIIKVRFRVFSTETDGLNFLQKITADTLDWSQANYDLLKD